MQETKSEKYLCLILGITVFIYIILRAIYVPPYVDEVESFFWYVQTGSFQPFYCLPEANNHLINSLFERIVFMTFGEGKFMMRLPNVLSFLVYFYFVRQIQKLFSKKFIGFSWFIIMLSCLYLIEFFSLGRGYGLSMASLMGAIFYLLKFTTSNNRKYLCAGLFMASLSLWSNLALMILILLLGFLFFILLIQKSIQSFRSKTIFLDIFLITALFIFPLYYAIKYSIYLKEIGHLYHGSRDTFLKGTVLDLVNELSGFYAHAHETFYFFLVVYILVSVYVVFSKHVNINSVIIHLLLWGTVAGTIALHNFMDVNYPQNRTAIQFFVLFVAAFLFF